MRCSICKLPERKRAAVDAALASGDVSLVAVSVSSGLSKSALQRHSKHLQAVEKTEADALSPAAMREPLEQQPLPTKESLLDRIEYLWNESLDGLELSKEPITLRKPDGSSVELPGDLRARVGFLREARSVLELQGAATGELIKGQPSQVGQVIIVIPVRLPGGEAKEYPVIDIAPGRR
jgi:hypothetical protein